MFLEDYSMITEVVIRTRYAETDQMGIIYHANYFVWFEIGRTEFLRQLNLSYKELEESNILLPVIDVGCKYLKPTKYDDEIVIKTALTSLKGVKLVFRYEVVRKSDGVLLAEGHTKHAFVNKELKPVNFKKKMSHIWNVLNECIEDRDNNAV